MRNQYQITITPQQNQIFQNPSNCSNVSTWGILTFTLNKNGLKDTSDWADLQIEVGDDVTWVWDPGNYPSGFPHLTSLAFLILAKSNGAQICTDENVCSKPKQSLADLMVVSIGTLHQKQSLPADFSCYSGKRTYLTPGTGKNYNTICASGSGNINPGNYLKLTYTIWLKTNNSGTYSYWYYDPEIDVKPASSDGPSNVQS